MIRATGVGSGLDIESIVSSLMAIERQPRDAVQQKREALQVQLSAFGKARSVISQLAESIKGFADSKQFGGSISTSSDEAVLTATASPSAGTGQHDVEVLSMAEAHQMSSDPYASQDSAVGTGAWSFASGGNSFDVTIDAGNDSLSGLRDAINSAEGNTSINASILNVDGGSRLVLTARETGTANEISASREVPSGGLLGGTTTEYPFSESRAAQDASLKVDGFTVTSSSNTISDVIDGVTLELQGTGTAEVDTSINNEATSKMIDEFIERYNKMRETLKSLGENKLSGDRLTRNVELRMQRAFNDPLELSDGSTIHSTELGFSFDRDGKLSIDEERLQSVQEADMARFLEAFNGKDNGLAQRFDAVLQEYSRPGGLISGREEGIESRTRGYDAQLDRFDYRLKKVEERYRMQFSTMDQLVSQLQSTSNSLAARFANGLS